MSRLPKADGMEMVAMLARCLPHIVPHVLLGKREVRHPFSHLVLLRPVDNEAVWGAWQRQISGWLHIEITNTVSKTCTAFLSQLAKHVYSFHTVLVRQGREDETNALLALKELEAGQIWSLFLDCYRNWFPWYWQQQCFIQTQRRETSFLTFSSTSSRNQMMSRGTGPKLLHVYFSVNTLITV